MMSSFSHLEKTNAQKLQIGWPLTESSLQRCKWEIKADVRLLKFIVTTKVINSFLHYRWIQQAEGHLVLSATKSLDALSIKATPYIIHYLTSEICHY